MQQGLTDDGGSFTFIPESTQEIPIVGLFFKGHAVSQHLAEAHPYQWSVSEEDRLRIACRAASIGVWQWDLLSNEMQYTTIAREICGFPLSGSITYEMVRDVTHPDDINRTRGLAKRALDPDAREKIEYIYRIIRADTGEIRWVKAYGEAQFGLVDGVERALHYIGSIQDITEEKQKEDALAESEARLRLAIEAGQMAVWEVDVESDTVIGSPELNRLCGFPEDSTPTLAELRSRYAPGERARITEEGRRMMAQGQTKLQFEIKHIWPDATVKWLLMRAQIGMNKTGTGMRVIGVVADITDGKQQEERLATVARELRHRLLNTISVIGALASRSWPAGYTEAKTNFLTRLRAIGKATDLMFSRDEGQVSPSLQRLLHDITDPYRSPDHDPFLFEGPEVTVESHLRPLAMAFHELCTNALKYGALSVPEGRVAVRWTIAENNLLSIEWQELDGPPVVPPDKTGLGTTLLNTLLFVHPNRLTLDYLEAGARCSIVLHN